MRTYQICDRPPCRRHARILINRLGPDDHESLCKVCGLELLMSTGVKSFAVLMLEDHSAPLYTTTPSDGLGDDEE